MGGRDPTNKDTGMVSKAELGRLILDMATTLVRLCRLLLEGAHSRRANSTSDRESRKPKAPGTLHLRRAKLWKQLRSELSKMVEDNAVAGPQLEKWLIDHPNAIVTQAATIKGREKHVKDILSQIGGAKDIQLAREILGIHRGVSADAIKKSLEIVKRSHRQR